MPKYPVGTRVHILGAGYDGQEGEIVGGSIWTANVAQGKDPGDRVVKLDQQEEELIFQSWMMIKV